MYESFPHLVTCPLAYVGVLLYFSVQVHFAQPPVWALPVSYIAHSLFSLATISVFCYTVRANDTANSQMNACSKTIREDKCFQTT